MDTPAARIGGLVCWEHWMPLARDAAAGARTQPRLVRGPDDMVLRGGSAIIAPDGSYVVAPVYDTPTILHAELHNHIYH